MTISLGMITFDTLDAGTLAGWWAEQTGGTEVTNFDNAYIVLLLSNQVRLAFQQVEDPTPGKNKIHLDMVAESDLDAEVARLQEGGAGLVAAREMPGFRWVTLTDPDGNQFCVSGPVAPGQFG